MGNTTHTEQERAEFEKAWASRPWPDPIPLDKGICLNWWKQGARRATAPPDEAIKRVMRLLRLYGEQMHIYGLAQAKGNKRALPIVDAKALEYSEAIKAQLQNLFAAVPQPPEVDHIPDAGQMVAAPVQLPDPIGYIGEHGNYRSAREHAELLSYCTAIEQQGVIESSDPVYSGKALAAVLSTK